MIDVTTIKGIIAEYERHDWKLMRVLATEEMAPLLRGSDLAANVDVISSELTALWFSRRSKPENETWELRRLTGTPYALDVFLDDTMSEEEREEILGDTEERMMESLNVFEGH